MAHLPDLPAISRTWLLLLALLSSTACHGERPPRNVLLITIDTLRADFLGSYGFAFATSPNIDELAEKSVVFETAIAAATITAPAHASIMTGRYVREHSIGILNGETRLVGGRTLAEHFAEAGYDTAAFVSNVALSKRTALDRGFAVYDDELPEVELNRPAYPERTAEKTAQRAIQWLETPRQSPFLLWLHLQDPHGPYTPPPDYVGRIGEVPLRDVSELPVLPRNSGRDGIPAYQALEGVRAPSAYAGRYAEEILYADHCLGRVITAARAASRAAGLIVLLTADHGESMGEHGWFFQHGQSTSPDLASVPMLLSAPGIEPARVDVPVSHVDVAPTLVALAGLPPLPGVSGRSLLPLVQGTGDWTERAIYCDTNGETGLYSVGRLSRLATPAAGPAPERASHWTRFRTFRVNEGGAWRPAPREESDRRALVAYLERGVPLVRIKAMTLEHIERLRALGYLEPPASESESLGPVPDTATPSAD